MPSLGGRGNGWRCSRARPIVIDDTVCASLEVWRGSAVEAFVASDSCDDTPIAYSSLARKRKGNRKLSSCDPAPLSSAPSPRIGHLCRCGIPLRRASLDESIIFTSLIYRGLGAIDAFASRDQLAVCFDDLKAADGVGNRQLGQGYGRARFGICHAHFPHSVSALQRAPIPSRMKPSARPTSAWLAPC